MKRLLTKKTDKGAPAIVLAIYFPCIILTSGCPIENSLIPLCILFLSSFLMFFYYRFPVYPKDRSARTYFSSLADPSLILAVIILLLETATFVFVNHFSHPWGWIRMLMVAGTAFFVTQTMSFQEFKGLVRKVFPVIVVFSLLFLSVYNIAGYCFTGTGIGPYSNFFLFYFSLLHSSYLGRNIGIFWEPGAYSSILIFCLVLEICFEKKSDWKRVTLYSITILTTASTAGIILLPATLALFVFKRFPNKWLQIIPFAASVLFLITVFFWQSLGDVLSRIMPFIFAKGTSFTSRVTSFEYGVRAFLQNPIFGTGNGFSAWSETFSSEIMDSYTSTTGWFLGYYGFLGVILFLAHLVGCYTIFPKNPSMGAMVFFITFMVINKESHSQLMFSWLLLFYAVEEGVRKNLVSNTHPQFHITHSYSLSEILANRRKALHG